MVRRLLTYGETVDEWVARILVGAPANGIVIPHNAHRAPAARIFTGVAASHIHTRLGLLAVSANETFGSAARWDSEITGKARAGGLIAKFATHAVGSARGGFTRLNAYYRDAT